MQDLIDDRASHPSSRFQHLQQGEAEAEEDVFRFYLTPDLKT